MVPVASNSAFRPFQLVEQVPQVVGDMGFGAKCRHRARETLDRLAAELTPDLAGESVLYIAVVAGHHLKS